MNTITSTDHCITPEVLPNKDSVPASVKEAYLAALKNSAVVHAVQRVVEARRDLLETAGFNSELGHAVLSTANDGDAGTVAILKELRQRELAFQALRSQAVEAQCSWRAKCEARREELRPVLVKVAQELLEADQKRTTVKQLIAGYTRAREAHRERLKAAGGLSDEEISKFVKPTPCDLEAWKLDLERIKVREQQLTAFMSSGPMYNVHLPDNQEAQ